MDIELFSNLIDALGKVMGGLKTLADSPKSERDLDSGKRQWRYDWRG